MNVPRCANRKGTNMQMLAIRVKVLEEEIGPFLQLTSDQALDQAILVDNIARDCGPHDPAYRMYKEKANLWLQAAELLEQREGTR